MPSLHHFNIFYILVGSRLTVVIGFSNTKCDSCLFPKVDGLNRGRFFPYPWETLGNRRFLHPLNRAVRSGGLIFLAGPGLRMNEVLVSKCVKNPPSLLGFLNAPRMKKKSHETLPASEPRQFTPLLAMHACYRCTLFFGIKTVRREKGAWPKKTLAKNRSGANLGCAGTTVAFQAVWHFELVNWEGLDLGGLTYSPGKPTSKPGKSSKIFKNGMLTCNKVKVLSVK